MAVTDAINTPVTTSSSPRSLDDVMLAMDIVDTLRHREQLIELEFGDETRAEKLIDRLREIYAAQGIDVPDRILEDGVRALEEKRFVYEPPRDSFPVRLAKIYVSRRRWWKPIAVVLGVAAFSTAAYEVGYAGPKEARERAAQIELTQTLPASLGAERDQALALAGTDSARRRIETAYQDGAAALGANDAAQAKSAIADLQFLKGVLESEATIRVVSRPGEMSGVFRVHDDYDNVKNYYLIVEAVDARGRAQTLEIASEEDRRVARVDTWGVRVPEAIFNSVAADKRDDQIIQHADVGRKPKGALEPEYEIATAGGAILEW